MRQSIIKTDGKAVNRRVVQKQAVTEEFRIVGLQFTNGLRMYGKLKVGDSLRLEAEEGNAKDANAVGAYVNDVRIGYVERDKAGDIRAALENFDAKNCECIISQKNDAADMYNKLKVVMYCTFYVGA